MPDIFISYSKQDSIFARKIYDQIALSGVTPFLAELSIDEGSRWNDEIWSNLKNSKWVIFLASKAACQSPYVNQEIGASIAQEKIIFPIVWDISPDKLPGWLKNYQAVDIAHPDLQGLNKLLQKITDKVKNDKFWAGIILGSLIVGFIWASKK